jgi:hypothetical protein
MIKILDFFFDWSFDQSADFVDLRGVRITPDAVEVARREKIIAKQKKQLGEKYLLARTMGRVDE